jgi:hypothetical protein
MLFRIRSGTFSSTFADTMVPTSLWNCIVAPNMRLWLGFFSCRVDGIGVEMTMPFVLFVEKAEANGREQPSRKARINVFTNW